MSDSLRKEVFNRLNLKETDELIEIWKTNDRVLWSETAFELTKEILEQRLGKLPTQNEPIFKHVEQEIDEIDKVIYYEKFLDSDNAPDFYKPKEIIRISFWLNRVSTAAVAITIIVNIPEFIRLQRIIQSFFIGNPQWNFVAWLGALIIGGLATALQCYIVYYSLKALASILRILMELEFNSHTAKKFH